MAFGSGDYTVFAPKVTFQKHHEKRFSYEEAGRIQRIRKNGRILSEEYKEDGIHVKAYVPVELFEELYAPM